MLLFMINHTSLAQQFENLNEKFPMSMSEVLFQDDLGFLWIGTKYGLYKYDGYSMDHFVHDKMDPSSISGNNINAITQDDKGRIWVGVRGGGINILNIKRDSFLHICLPLGDSCIQNLSVNAFAKKSENEMWVGTYNGLYLFDTDKIPSFIMRVFPDSTKNSLKSPNVNHLLKDSKGRLWVGTNSGGIHMYRSASKDFINHQINEGFPSYPILDIEEDRNGKIWISTRFSTARLYYYDEKEHRFIVDSTLLGTHHGDFKFTFDFENNMWISARGRGSYFIDANTGEYKFYDRKNAERYGFTNFFSVQTICDKFGNIWIGGESLLKMPNTGKDIEHLANNNGKIFSIYRTDKWLWYSSTTPIRYDLIKNEARQFIPEKIPTNLRADATSHSRYKRVSRIIQYDNDNLIFNFFRNIVIWNFKLDTYTEYALDYGGPFKDIGLTKDKSHLWICNNLGSPLLLDLNTGKKQIPSYIKEIKRPNRIIRDSLGNYWFSTVENGVYKLDTNYKITQFYFNQADETKQLPEILVYDLAISAQNILWLATNKGIFKIDAIESKIIPFQQRHPYIDLFSTAIIIDDQNKVWFNTHKGIVKIDPGNNKVNLFGHSDGLKNMVYATRSVYKDANGKIYFGGDKGIDIINPKVISYNKIKPEIYIKNLWINDQLFELPGEIDQERYVELHHNENFITFELLGLHLTAPSNNQYAYNIPEIDEKWRELDSKRRVSLANISPGNYTVNARASNADGVWSKPKKLITIDILPPWWNTYWFMGGSAIILGLLIFGAYQYRIKTIKERERLKTQYNKQIAEVESKALRAQMNPHFLFNSINAVNALISRGNNESASIYLKKFGKLIRIVLSNSEKSMVRLEEELEALRLYLEIEQLRFQNFEYEIALDPFLDVDFIEVPPLLLQPYVENAIWHGLLHRAEGSRKVIVQVFAEGDDLVMTVEDNGIGRERASQLKTKNTARKKGMGMRLTQNRLELLKHLNNSKVSIDIKDLYDDQNHPKGTLIKIKISDLG